MYISQGGEMPIFEMLLNVLLFGRFFSNVLQAVHADQRILPVTCRFLLLGRLFLHPVVLVPRTPSTCVLQMYFLQRRKKRSH